MKGVEGQVEGAHDTEVQAARLALYAVENGGTRGSGERNERAESET